jgi:FMN phosphatase YigB (HAD superfamily)
MDPALIVSQMTRIASMLAPERAAREAAKRKFASFALDANNFSHPDQLKVLVSGYQLISFDLFDTLVWREIALEDVHAKTAEFADHMISGDDGPMPKGLLLHARDRHQQAIKDTGMADKDNYRNEVDLADVFDSALVPYISDPIRRARAVEALIAFEIETERRVLTVDPVMRDFLVTLRAQGKTVILTSDMYFSDRWLRLLLQDLGLLSLFDHVFVSASVGVTKNSGKLFDHIDKVLGCAVLRRLHVGDNWTNDVSRPREHGWDALHYLSVDNEMRKDRLERVTRLGGHRRPTASRGLIRQIETVRPEHALVRLVTAGFLSFARQVVTTAVQGRYDRVLFLTRDGTIYHHMVRQLIADCGAGPFLDLPQFEDLAFSRRSGVLLTCPDMEDPDWQGYIHHHVHWMRGEAVTLGSIMRAFALSADDLAGMRGLGDRADDCIDGLPNADLPFDDLMSDPDLAKALDEALQTKRQRVVDYLDQHDLFEPDQRILLVDIGYSGTILKSLSEHIYTLENSGRNVRTRMSLMMLAANRFFAGNLSRMHPRATMLDPTVIGRADWRDRAAAFNFAWLEPFAVDRTRGSLRDFRPDDEGVLHPVFGAGSPDDGPVSRTRILDTARDIDKLLRISPVSQETAENAIRRAIADRFSQPKRSTLKAVDGLTHQAGLTDVVEGDLLGHVRLWNLRPDLSRCLHEDCWVQGSMTASRLGWLNPLLNRVIGLITR